MKITTMTFILTLLLSTCGGSDGNGGDNPKADAKTVFDPWKGIGIEPLSEDEVTERVRTLSFSDGMTVSYDGSSADGEELVCRGGFQVEENDDGTESTSFYEVCMPLEDDPYFVMLESNAFVWHPLMFDRFATDLICRQWAEGDDSKTDADCEDVYALFGEDFRCEAGLVAGDKALKCSDDWAVAVNGEDDDTKTLCRVHIETGAGRCLDAPREGIEDAALILSMQRSTWEGYSSHRNNPAQFAPGDSAEAPVPQDLPAGARLTWWSEDDSVCTVDDDDSDGGAGMVTILPGATVPEVCKIYLKVEAPGFADRTLFAELSVLKDNDAEWDSYVRPNNYFYPGETVSAGAVTSTDPASTDNMYTSLDESICMVDAMSGELTAVAAGECVIRLTATAGGHLDKVIEKIIRVDALIQFGGIVWGDFPATATVAVDTAALAAPEVQDGDGNALEGAMVAITTTDNCAWDGDGKILSFVAGGECVVSVTASGIRGYADRVQEFRVTPADAAFTLSWDGYANSNATTYGADAPALEDPSVTPADLEVTYLYSAEGGGCEVDGETGALTIVGADVTDTRSCTVTLSATRSGYSEQNISQTVTVARADQPALSATAPYGGVRFVTAGGMLAISTPPEGGLGPLIYSMQSGGSNCSVDMDGTVTATGASGSCVVQARWDGDDNYNPSAEERLVSLSIAPGTNPTPAWSAAPYGTSPTVGGAAVSLSGGAITNSAIGGTLGFRSKTPQICGVDSMSGALSALAAGDCTVQARFVGSSAKGASGWGDSPVVTTSKGTQSAPADDSSYYGSGASVPAGDVLELVAAPEGHGAASYTVASGSGTFCQVDGATGAITGLAEGDCTIQVAFAGDDNYNASDAAHLQTVTVGEPVQKILAAEPYGTEPSMRVGEVLAVVNAPSATAGESAGGLLTYRIATGSESVCEVVPASGAVTARDRGECPVQIRAGAVQGYALTPWTDIATIVVDRDGLLSIAWTPQKRGRVGADLVLPAATDNTGGAAFAYEVADAGETDCAFQGSSGAAERTLSFDVPGICRVLVRGTKELYEDFEIEHAIVVRPGIITVANVSGFAANRTLPVGPRRRRPEHNYSGVNPASADASWQLVRGERDCVVVDSAVGLVSARAQAYASDDSPECSIQLVAHKENYEVFKSAPVSIPLEKGTLGTVTPQEYGFGSTTLSVSGHLDMTAPPTEDLGLPVAYAFAVAGANALGEATADVCVVDDNPDSGTYGRVSAGSAPPGVDYTCEITATLSSLGYVDKTATVTLTFKAAPPSFSGTPTFSYSSNLQIGNSAALTADVTGLDNQSGAITWTFHVEGEDSEGDPKSGVCSVVTADGELSLGASARAGGRVSGLRLGKRYRQRRPHHKGGAGCGGSRGVGLYKRRGEPRQLHGQDPAAGGFRHSRDSGQRGGRQLGGGHLGWLECRGV